MLLDTKNSNRVHYFAYGSNIKPFSWYTYHVLKGAAQAWLPDDYIRKFIKVPDLKDPEESREMREWYIYEN